MTSRFLRCLTAAVLSMTVLGVAAPAAAASIFIQFRSTGANGDVNGVAFTNAKWLLEFEASPILDSDPDAGVGQFLSAIVGGALKINDTVYTLTGRSTAGQIALYHVPGAYDTVEVMSANIGGYFGNVGLLTVFGGIYPQLFANHNSLSSANIGTTVFNTTTDPLENTSGLNFGECYAPDLSTILPCLLTDGGAVNISQAFDPADGLLSVTVSDTSAIPEPGSLLLMGNGLVIVALRLRRRLQR